MACTTAQVAPVRVQLRNGAGWIEVTCCIDLAAISAADMEWVLDVRELLQDYVKKAQA